MSRRWRTLIGICLAWTTTCTLLAPAAAASSLTAYRHQESVVATELASAQQQYTNAVAAWSVAHQRYLQAEAVLILAARRLNTLESETSQAKAALARLRQEVVAAKAVVATDRHKADQGLVILDKHGTVSFVGVLLGSNSFQGFLTRMSMLRRVWTLEMGFLNQARLAQQHLQVLEQRQNATVVHLDALTTQAAAQVRLLHQRELQAAAAKQAETTAVAQANRIVASLAWQRNSLQQKIAALLAALQSGNVPWSQVLQDINLLAKQYGIDPLLVEAVVLQESGGASGAKSPVGAQGLMQLMPATAAALGVNNAYNPVQNLRGGITYLLEMLQRFHGNLSLALAAYNAGPYAVQRYGGIPPYQQTQNYVHNILALYHAGR